MEKALVIQSNFQAKGAAFELANFIENWEKMVAGP